MAYYMENTREEEIPRVEVKRGEVWYLKAEGFYGHEQGLGRPVVIVSSDIGNESACPTVLGAFLTTTTKVRSVNVRINSIPKPGMILCNQLVTIDRERLSRKIGELTDSEKEKLDKTLGLVLGLNLQTTEKDKDLVQIERDLYKRLYTKALEKLSDIQFEQNVRAVQPTICEAEPEPEPVIEEPKPKKVKNVVEKPEIVDINTAPLREIASLGFSISVASGIYKLRPYANVEELRLVPGVTATKFEEIRDRIVCNEPEIIKVPRDKVNLNEATYDDLRAIGFVDRVAKEIIRYRDKFGSFNSVGELMNVTRLGKNIYNKMKNLVEV